MKLSRKVFLYTALTTTLVGTLIISYFMFMLPGLYVDYKSQSYLNAMIEIQTKTSKADVCQLTTDSGLMNATFIVPNNDDPIILCTPFFSGKFQIVDNVLNEYITEVKGKIRSSKETFDFETIQAPNLEHLKLDSNFENVIKMIEMNPSVLAESFSSTNNRFTRINNKSFIASANATSDENSYINYFGLDLNNEKYLVLTFGSAMTPKLSELSPIILGSVPMITVLLIVFALVTAKFFSKHLAEPVETLARQALNLEENNEEKPFCQKHKNDEFMILEDSLNQMYQENIKNLENLKRNNITLEYEKAKQDIFLMNGSHQMKTPISGALLLLDGMINKVGKYENTDLYLLEVRKEVLRLKIIVDKLIENFKEVEEKQLLDIEEVITNILKEYAVLIDEKALEVLLEAESVKIETQPEKFYSIVDHLILNAITYADDQTIINITLRDNELVIKNKCTPIDDETMKYIFEPFIRDAKSAQSGTGLGLFIVDQYVKELGYEFKIENGEECVIVTLKLREGTIDDNN